MARFALRLGSGLSLLVLAVALLALLVHLGTAGIVSWVMPLGTWEVPVAVPAAFFSALAYGRCVVALRRR
ncbi:hypothetical protein [Verrucosispora sp. TAA-831]|uniref:hypothetical protein n=1 Tax=Verrucosispora sp. TAA-831 TaxID=3422227 RepID=UPI003D6ECF73